MSKEMSPEKQRAIFKKESDLFNMLTTQVKKSWQLYIDSDPRNTESLCRDPGRFIYVRKLDPLKFVMYPFQLNELVKITSCIKGLEVVGLLRSSSFYWFPKTTEHEKTGYEINLEDPSVLEELIQRLRDCYDKNKIKTIRNEDLSKDFQRKFKVLYNNALEEHLKKDKT
ncbi:hypothetical protein N7692_19050 [Klebsiella michiganensis]|uniref:hypothetical protein n=1 Tax=Klebsiella TaxID=570 RepID=UPI0012B92C19|nr:MULTISPECIES: hypothetical protein [Klebsiella]MBD0905678.1 hypothetical protein [Klebsiella grimontii]MDH0489706.1 hypothetical protein [Klebsiella michiganensis]